MFCSNCGKQVNQNANFCENCGIPLKRFYAQPRRSFMYSPFNTNICQSPEFFFYGNQPPQFANSGIFPGNYFIMFGKGFPFFK